MMFIRHIILKSFSPWKLWWWKSKQVKLFSIWVINQFPDPIIYFISYELLSTIFWRLDNYPLFATTHSLHSEKSKQIRTLTLFLIKSCLIPKKLFVIVMQYLNHSVQSLRPISHVHRNRSLISHYKRDKMVVVVIDIFGFGQLTLAITWNICEFGYSPCTRINPH